MRFAAVFAVVAAVASAASAFYVPLEKSGKGVSLTISNGQVVADESSAYVLADTTASICSSKTAIFDITSLKLPEPIYVNAPLKIAFSGNARKAFGVPGTTKVDITVKLGIITVLKESLDLCELLDNTEEAEEKCPISEGYHDIEAKVADELPSIIPSGTKLNIGIKGVEGSEEVFCLNVVATLRKQ